MTDSTPLVATAAVTVLAEGLDHPEGVAWDPQARVLYAGGEAGQLYAIEGGTVREVADTGGFALGLALDGEGRVYCCSGERVVRVTPATGAVEVYSDGSPDRAMFAPNYPSFAADGTLYVSDSGEWSGENGVIYRISPGGDTSIWTSALPMFPNGCCLTPSGDALAVVQSQRPGVWSVPIQSDGSAGEPHEICLLPDTVPDGVAYDRDGALFVTCYRPDRIYRVGVDGGIEVVAEDPTGNVLAAPTNLAFYGDDLERLGVANLGAQHLSCLDAGVRGLPLARPKLADAGA